MRQQALDFGRSRLGCAAVRLARVQSQEATAGGPPDVLAAMLPCVVSSRRGATCWGRPMQV
eukprot:12895598-Prorocentrum_lima.AAC.1